MRLILQDPNPPFKRVACKSLEQCLVLLVLYHPCCQAPSFSVVDRAVVTGSVVSVNKVVCPLELAIVVGAFCGNNWVSAVLRNEIDTGGSVMITKGRSNSRSRSWGLCLWDGHFCKEGFVFVKRPTTVHSSGCCIFGRKPFQHIGAEKALQRSICRAGDGTNLWLETDRHLPKQIVFFYKK